MADTKFACPHCNGHIAYAIEMGGRGVACPHCHQSIILPKRHPRVPMIIIAVLGLVLVGLGASVIFELIRGHQPRHHPPAQAALPPRAQPGTFIPMSQDDRDIEKLCQQYYGAQAARDAKTVYELFSESAKKALIIDDVFIDNATYISANLESIEYRNGNPGRSARAKVKRTAQTSAGGAQETTRDLQFVQETDGWKIFPVFDLAREIVSEFTKNGFSEAATNGLQLLRDGDAFNVWDQNYTNAFEAAFKLDQHHDGIFPWDMAFSVDSNKVDNLILIMNYSLGNQSSNTWPSALLEFNLKQDGNIVSTENDLLPAVQGGEKLQRSVSFLLADKLQQTTEYFLDVTYPDGFQSHFPLIKNLPLEFTVRSVSELAKLEVVGTQFDSTVSADSQNIFSARIDYQVQNISSEPIQSLDIKCAWFSVNGEQIDQTTEYVVGYGDTPLGVGESKTGSVRCAKGSPNTRVPVKVDVYLESGDKRTLVSKGLLIQ